MSPPPKWGGDIITRYEMDQKHCQGSVPYSNTQKLLLVPISEHLGIKVKFEKSCIDNLMNKFQMAEV